MKRKIISLFVWAAALFAVVSGYAQHQDHGYFQCGTDQQQAKVFAEHPELKADWEAREAQEILRDQQDFANNYGRNERNSVSVQSPPTYIIPVVFHVIHDYGTENISDAQILDQMRILNEDFRKLNADTSSIVSQFVGIADDAEIEFRLANLDPNGNCTNGIDRIASMETYVGDDGSKLNAWPRNRYLNVWVVRTISNGAAGYAYLPGGAPTAAVDGIIIVSTYVGSIGSGNPTTGRALTHEIGHFLNLQHCWGSTNNPNVACGNDGVSDTPVTKGWTSCNLTNNAICNANVSENVQNFMDYSYCYRMFTAGQCTRMRAALNNSAGQRNQLSTSTTHTATGILNNPPNTCAPKADFTPVDKRFVCEGGSVTFSDLAWNGPVTSWSWQFPGGSPSTSTDSIPTVQYNTAGSYAVTLTVANAAGSNSITRTGHVVVSPTTAQYSTNPYTEGFENATNVTQDWVIINPQGNGWVRSTSAAATGSACMRLDNTTAMLGTIDEMMSPSLNLSAIGATSMTFKVAFAQRQTGDADKLRVLVSTDCGATWSQRYSKTGATLSTANATTAAYVPNAAQWRTETVTFTSAMQNAANVRVKFEFTSDGGNDIWIDDINLNAPTSVNAPEAGVNAFTVFPNPTNDNTLIAFNLEKQENLQILVLDMTGREVMNVFNGSMPVGNHQIPLNVSTLSAGTYFIRVEMNDGRAVTQKLLVQ
jgi:PKD repeat protein